MSSATFNTNITLTQTGLSQNILTSNVAAAGLDASLQIMHYLTGNTFGGENYVNTFLNQTGWIGFDWAQYPSQTSIDNMLSVNVTAHPDGGFSPQVQTVTGISDYTFGGNTSLFTFTSDSITYNGGTDVGSIYIDHDFGIGVKIVGNMTQNDTEADVFSLGFYAATEQGTFDQDDLSGGAGSMTSNFYITGDAGTNNIQEYVDAVFIDTIMNPDGGGDIGTDVPGLAVVRFDIAPDPVYALYVHDLNVAVSVAPTDDVRWFFGASSDCSYTDIQIIEPLDVITDMELVTNMNRLPSIPVTVSVSLLALTSTQTPTIAANTDIQVFVSRDDGTSYSPVNLVKSTYVAMPTAPELGQIFEGNVDLSGQPSDQNLRFKVVATNGSVPRVYGLVYSAEY